MDDENKYTVAVLLRYSAEQQPIEFEDAFDSLMVDKLANAVNDKKLEMAASIFSDPDEDEEDTDDEYENEDEVEELDFEDNEEEYEEEDSDGEVA